MLKFDTNIIHDFDLHKAIELNDLILAMIGLEIFLGSYRRQENLIIEESGLMNYHLMTLSSAISCFPKTCATKNSGISYDQ